MFQFALSMGMVPHTMIILKTHADLMPVSITSEQKPANLALNVTMLESCEGALI